MTEQERQELKGVFGTYGQLSWTGLRSLHRRFAAVESSWVVDMPRRHARFFHLWVHRENNETLHPSAYSLANVGGPELVGDDELHYMTGSTEHLVADALMCAYWTYMQTVDLIFETYEMPGYETAAGRHRAWTHRRH